MGAKVSGCVGPEVNGSTGAEVSGSTGPEVNGATASGDSGKAGPGVNGNAGPGVSSTGVSFFSAATFDVGSTATLFLMAMASGAVVNELVARAFCLQGTFCFQGGIDTDFAKGVGGVARAVAACVRDVTAEFAAMAPWLPESAPCLPAWVPEFSDADPPTSLQRSPDQVWLLEQLPETVPLWLPEQVPESVSPH